MLIRRATADDATTIHDILIDAFTRRFGSTVEAGLAAQLVMDGDVPPELNLVAELDGQVVGHSVTSRGAVVHSDGTETPALGLGPIGVAPDLQRGAVGTALMHASLGAADALGEPIVALLGDPAFYGRFGFVTSTDVGIAAPDENWGVHFQVRTLSTHTPDLVGTFRYAAAFDSV